jgi:hypothetical protein
MAQAGHRARTPSVLRVRVIVPEVVSSQDFNTFSDEDCMLSCYVAESAFLV